MVRQLVRQPIYSSFWGSAIECEKVYQGFFLKSLFPRLQNQKTWTKIQLVSRNNIVWYFTFILFTRFTLEYVLYDCIFALFLVCSQVYGLVKHLLTTVFYFPVDVCLIYSWWYKPPAVQHSFDFGKISYSYSLRIIFLSQQIYTKT